MRSNKQLLEVGLQDFVLLLLHAHRSVVRREDQVDLSAQSVHARHPEERSVHTLFKAVLWVVLELKVHLVKHVLQVDAHHLLRHQALHLNRQVHLAEVKEPHLALVVRGNRPRNLLVQKLAQHAHLSAQVSVQLAKLGVGDQSLWVQKHHEHRLVAEVDKHRELLELSCLVFDVHIRCVNLREATVCGLVWPWWELRTNQELTDHLGHGGEVGARSLRGHSREITLVRL